MSVLSFNLVGLTISEKSVPKNCNVSKLERKKNEEIKGQIGSSSLIPVNMIHLHTVHVCTKFQSSRPHSSWEKCDEKFKSLKIGEKEKWRNKGMNRQQQPDSGIHDTFERLWNDRVTEWRKDKANPVQIEDKISQGRTFYPGVKCPRGQDKPVHRYTRYICPLSMCVPSFNLLGVTVPEKSVTKNFHLKGYRMTEWWEDRANPV